MIIPKITETMKKNYIQPSAVAVEFYVEAAILNASKPTTVNDENATSILSNKKESHPIWGE